MKYPTAEIRNYLLAVMLFAAAAALRWILEYFFGLVAPSIAFYPAVILAALICGVGPAFLAIALSGITLVLLPETPTWSSTIVASALFCLSGVLLVIMSHRIAAAKAETARGESEKKYRMLVERANDGIIIVQDGVVKYANPKMAELDGSSVELLTGSPITDHIYETDMAKVAGMFRRRMAGEDVPSVYEAVLKRRNGEAAHAELNVGLIVYNDKPAALVIIRDITERKRSEQALRESEERFTKAFHFSPVGMTINRPDDGVFLDANESFLHMSGYTREEIIGHTPFDLRMYVDQDEPARLISTLREQGGVRDYEIETRIKSGKLITMLCSTIMITLNGRENLITTFIDISNRKRAEEVLRKSQEELERRVQERTSALSETNRKLAEQAFMLANINDAVIGLDLDRRITYFSKSAEKIYGYSAKEVLGRPGIEIFKPYYLGITGEEVDQKLKSAGQMNCEAFHATKDGRSIVVEIHAGLLYNDEGKPTGILEINHDITERKRINEEKEKLEEQLRQAQKMEAIGTLAGGIAHDFNNMLAAILGNSELALDELDGAVQPRRYIEQIIKASKRARDLVKQILAFSRKTEQGKNIISLIPLVKETFVLLRGTLPSTIQMELKVHTEKDTIMADASQVQQVLMNLATNAYHAMRADGGNLAIEISDTVLKNETLPDADIMPGPYVKLAITDTGPGIRKEILHRIFEPFFTTKESGQGTGMGLAVAYGIVKSHGGAITVDSIRGKGATFTLFFPYMDSRGKTEEDDKATVPRGGERILLVDDEPSVVESVKTMLERLGYTVITATSASEAFEVFQKNSSDFDLLITDQMMPDITGLDLTQRMREIRKNIPVILFTGYDETITTEKRKETGVREVLMKPVTKREIAETVRKVLDSG